MSDAPNNSHVPDRVVALLEKTPPFDRLAPELRAQLPRDLEVEYFEPGEQILRPGDTPHHLYIVESGCVRIVDKTNQQLVDLCGEGDTFGAVGILTNTPSPYECVTTEPTVCALLCASGFLSLCDADSQFAGFFKESLRPSARAMIPSSQVGGARLLFGTRVAALARRKPSTCPPDTTVRDAAIQMRSDRSDAILVVRNGLAVGILTDTDLRNKVVAENISLDTPVMRIMSSPVFNLGSRALVFEALTQMSKLRIHHLVITENADAASPLIGVLSEHDLAHASGQSPLAIVKRIEKARSLTELAQVRTEANGHLTWLYRQGVQPEDVMEAMTEINDNLTVRLLHLAETQLASEWSFEPVNLRWTWLNLGSMGRHEMALGGDQDNALLYEDPPDPFDKEKAEQWFSTIAKRVNMGLAACGLAFCKGGVMASNAKWRQPLGNWKQIFSDWITEPEPKALMHASIFFDLRALYRDTSLVDELKDDLRETLGLERGFLTFLTHNALSHRPPLSFFRRFMVDHSGEFRNTLDLKFHGIMPLVDLARILALEGRFLKSTNTFERLRHAGRELPYAADLAAAGIGAFRYLLDMRLGHQFELLEAGLDPNDHINPDDLSKTQQKILRAVFATIKDMQETLAHRHGEHMMRR
ncbi:MAG: putative nucleotidyltransferase substrate binding domain-containing protein [Kiritimatiellia bacterium]|jgi:CBS domain-containing protein|nr:putative nucleotidyltransferase substrate binding domain-containing protein [Kiritimatiellia bacterium]